MTIHRWLINPVLLLGRFFKKTFFKKILLRIFRVVLLFNLHSVFIVLNNFASLYSMLLLLCFAVCYQRRNSDYINTINIHCQVLFFIFFTFFIF